MRTFAGIAVWTAGFLAAGTGTASAAWDNVFQTCCNSCGTPAPRSSFFAPDPSPCCPSVSYQQRCCWQPYTAFKQESYFEPVTTYRTSFFWEPVTTYRYTSFYDPCTGCCKQVATPCTSYQLRSQCNACQSYVQRCRMVPYTAYRQSCYLEPVASCPPPACPSCPTGGAPAVSEQPPASPPADRRPLPGVSEDSKNLPPQGIQNKRRTEPNTGAPVRTDRIASNGNGRLQGTIVSDDQITPKSGARIFFTSVSDKGNRYSAQADPTGRFAIELPPGDWELYMSGKDGNPAFHSQISVKSNDQRLVTVVSR
jgi:hypothetical protein